MTQLYITKYLLIACAVTFGCLLLTASVSAQDGGGEPTKGLEGGGAPIKNKSTALINPLTGTSDRDEQPGIPEIIGRVINAALGIVGSLALVMFIYGGLLWMTSAGNDERVKQGVQILIWTTAGLALVFFSYLLVNFLIKGITKQSLSGQNTGNSIDQEKLREKGLVP